MSKDEPMLALSLVSIVVVMVRGGGPKGARAPLRIGDLRTKIFEN